MKKTQSARRQERPVPQWLTTDPLAMVGYQNWVRRKRIQVPGPVPNEWRTDAVIDHLCKYAGTVREYIVHHFWHRRQENRPSAFGYNSYVFIETKTQMLTSARLISDLANYLDAATGRPCVGEPKTITELVLQNTPLCSNTAKLVADYAVTDLRNDILEAVEGDPNNLTTENLYYRLDGSIILIRANTTN